jgi:hypothetical protein
MDKFDVLTAMHCDFNYLWKCKHSDKDGIKCTGPCSSMEVYGTLIKNNTKEDRSLDHIMCPVCNSPVEFGYCISKLCVNHG